MQPYYQSSGITIYHGSCLDVLPTLEAKSIDAVIDDLPYGTTQCAWDVVIPFAPMWLQLARIVKRRTPMVLFGTQPFTSLLIASNLEQFRYSLIWDKGRGFEPQLANIRPMKAHEDIAVFGIKSPAYYPQMEQLHKPDKRNPKSGSPNRQDGRGHQILSGSSLLTGPREYTERFPQSIVSFSPVPQTERLHDSQKPIALMAYLIQTYSQPGDTILDFTAGSGTTGVAAKQLGRRAILIDTELKHVEIAALRLQQEVMAL